MRVKKEMHVKSDMHIKNDTRITIDRMAMRNALRGPSGYQYLRIVSAARA
jgi:hypothetical protein